MLNLKNGIRKIQVKKVVSKFLKSNKQTPKISFTQKQTYAESKKQEEELESAAGLDIAELMIKSTPKDTTAKQEHAFSTDIVDKSEYVEPSSLIDRDVEKDPTFYAYKTKYPDEKYEDWMKKATDCFLDDVPVTKQFIEDAAELSGFTKREIKGICEKRIPEFASYDSNGEFQNIKWENVKAEFKFDQRVNSVIDQIDTSYNILEERHSRGDEIMSNLQYMDWQKAEKKNGEENTLVLRERLRKMFVDSYKVVDVGKLESNLNKVFNPLVDLAKDELIDSYPLIQRLSQANKTLNKQLEVDADGIPVWDYTSIEFIDTFYPEIRDEILVEIDHFDFDTEYKEQMKQLSHQTTDDLFTLVTDEYWRQVIDKSTNEFFRNYEDTSDTKRNILVAKAKYDLDEKIQENARLSSAVSKLKSQLEYVDDAKDDSKKTEEKSVDMEKGNEILKNIGIDPEGKLVIVKDWKHKPHEVVVEERAEEEK